MDMLYSGNGTQPPFSAPVGASEKFFEQYLKERAIEKEWGVFKYMPPKIVASHSAFLGGDGQPVGAFMFVNHDEQGRPREDLSQVRYDTTNKNERFRFPFGVGVVAYAPLPTSYGAFANSNDKYIAEGVGKTLALVGLGKAVAGIPGVEMWHLKGEETLMPTLASRINAGDRVTIVIDADIKTNRNVHIAAFRLFEALKAIGAKPLLLDISDVPGLPKTGIDDLIAYWRNSGVDVHKAFDALPRLEEVPSPFVVDLNRPLDTAKNFIAERYTHDDGRTLAHWQEDFYVWENGLWKSRRDELIQKEIYEFMDGNGVPPKKHTAANIEHALRVAAQIKIDDAPAWVTQANEANIDQLIPLSNGILNIETRELLPVTPTLFNLSYSNVPYDPDANCPRWEQFLLEIYPGDSEAIECLQEYIGYCVTPDTSQHKALMLVGVKRSGKGTIERVLRRLVGEDAATNPTLQSLGEYFGREPLIGKRIAVISDARSSVRNNTQAMVESILTITGEDAQQIPRKFKKAWEGRLRVKIILISNMLPSTQDSGAALASRFLILNHRVSFYGKEDTQLEQKLNAELPGILNWALRGLARLNARGRFEQPKSGEELTRDWEDMNSPVKSFLRDCCEMGPDYYVEKSSLRHAFVQWCSQKGINHHVDDSHFTQELLAASEGSVSRGQRKIGDKKGVWVFVGVRLRDLVATGSKY
jgi:putative DNA primase/helicase